MKMHRYQAFGLNLQSDIELPMLLPAKKYAKVVLSIHKGSVAATGIKSPKVKQLHFQASPEKFWLRIPNVALFLITKGNTIVYQRDPAVDEQTLAVFLLGTCMGALLQQRNSIILHAMAVKVGNQAVVFASFSGEGKSLLAAAMHKQGYQIITDDLCVINEQSMVLPGYPVLKIWQDCFMVLELTPSQLKRIRPGVEKYAYPLGDGFYQNPLPVKAVYLLHSSNKDEPELIHINGAKKLMPLQSQTYRLQYLDGLGLAHSNMHNLMKLAGSIKLTKLVRPGKFKVAQWIELIESDLNSEGEKNA